MIKNTFTLYNSLDNIGLFLPFLGLRQELRGSAKPGAVIMQ
jgi:hypothetical protein